MPQHEISVSERFNDAGDPDGYRWRIGYETGVVDETGYRAIEAAVRKAIGPPLPEGTDNPWLTEIDAIEATLTAMSEDDRNDAIEALRSRFDEDLYTREQHA